MSGAGRLTALLQASSLLAAILRHAEGIGLPDWYLAAGCIAQTVWNAATGRPAVHGIRDIDIVYFDATDLSVEGEREHEARLRQLLSEVPVKLDVKNQARVHCWYREAFDYDIPPYRSIEDAIGNYPTTATAVGVRPEGDGMAICAPFGLDDLFGLVVRPNRRQITQAIYEAKVARWRALWPGLGILGWDQA